MIFFILSLVHAQNDIYNNIFLRKVILFRIFFASYVLN